LTSPAPEWLLSSICKQVKRYCDDKIRRQDDGCCSQEAGGVAADTSPAVFSQTPADESGDALRGPGAAPLRGPGAAPLRGPGAAPPGRGAQAVRPQDPAAGQRHRWSHVARGVGPQRPAQGTSQVNCIMLINITAQHHVQYSLSCAILLLLISCYL